MPSCIVNGYIFLIGVVAFVLNWFVNGGRTTTLP